METVAGRRGWVSEAPVASPAADPAAPQPTSPAADMNVRRPM